MQLHDAGGVLGQAQLLGNLLGQQVWVGVDWVRGDLGIVLFQEARELEVQPIWQHGARAAQGDEQRAIGSGLGHAGDKRGGD